MDKNLKDILDTVTFIKEKVEQLPTEERVRELIKEEVPPIVREIVKAEVTPIVREVIVEIVPGIVALELKPITERLKHIEDRLDTLDEHYSNLKGVTKEIDDLRRQVRAIQKHLGLSEEVAA